MEAEDAEKYRSCETPLRVTPGGQYGRRTVVDVDLERWLDCEFHTFYVQAVDDDGHVPSEAISDIRRHRQHPWRVEGRRIREMILADVDDDVLDELPFVWQRFIQRCRELKRNGRLGSNRQKHGRAA